MSLMGYLCWTNVQSIQNPDISEKTLIKTKKQKSSEIINIWILALDEVSRWVLFSRNNIECGKFSWTQVAGIYNQPRKMKTNCI